VAPALHVFDTCLSEYLYVSLAPRSKEERIEHKEQRHLGNGSLKKHNFK